MAMNPMKRRSRNSFLIGFLVALIIMAFVVMGILYKMQELKKNYNNLVAKQQKVYVAGEYIQSGTEVTIDSFKQDTVQTNISKNDMVQISDFEAEIDDQGNTTPKKVYMKTDVPAGTIITKDLLEWEEQKTTKDQRMQEYNMIVLPTLLKNGEYIDIRLLMPTGEDYVVVSKKKVEHTDATTVWMKMYEDEILLLSNAIVEAYTIEGSKLYAVPYTQAGMQDAAVTTYSPSKSVWDLINKDPNVIEESKLALWERYENQEQVSTRQNIQNTLGEYSGSQNSSVEAGLQEELTIRQAAREEFVDSLMGTGDVGTE